MARLLSGIVGHELIIDRLLSAAERGKIPQSFLFVGPSGVGKRLTAIAFAQALICESETSGCGICGPCLRVARGNSEGLLVIEPEKNLIKIDQIRKVLEFLHLQAISKARVIVIDNCQQMNPQASNSLLKSLEEPPEATFFFLIAPSPKHVLPTIRSRCQVVSFAPLKLAEIASKSAAPDWAQRASQGSFEKLALLSEKEELETREHAINCLRRLQVDHWAYLDPEVKNGFRDRAQAMRLSQHLALLLKDSAFWQMNAKEKILNADQEQLFLALSAVPGDQLLDAAMRALQMENALMQNRDPMLVFEEFWLKTEWRA